jgi:hypothetical protein
VLSGKQDLQQAVAQDNDEYLDELRRDLVIHAWLANWDAVGMGYDNVLHTSDGKKYTIDGGGSLLYRAQGTPKGKAFGDQVTELDTMRDKGMNPYAASVFGGTTDEQLRDGAKRLEAITPEQIDMMVEDSGFSSPTVKAELAARLKARRQDILDKVLRPDQATAPAASSSSSTSTPEVKSITHGDVSLSGTNVTITATGQQIGKVYFQSSSATWVARKPDGTIIWDKYQNQEVALSAVIASHNNVLVKKPKAPAKKLPTDDTHLSNHAAYEHPEYVPDMPAGSQLAIKYYTNDGFGPINGYLRAGMYDGRLLDEKMEKRVRLRTKQLDAAFEHVKPITKPIVVQRGAKSANKMFGMSNAVGAVFKDDGFISTSAWQGFSGDAEITIQVPAGAKVLKVGNYGGKFGHGESELLLPRGSRFRVLEDSGPTKGGAGVHRKVKLELIL